ncbi:MAG: glutamate mutase L [bacterium]|nr:glutamate mutase L [bacterium]
MSKVNVPHSIIATDCGSTTTKAILIEEREGEYRLAARGEAPTTVEAPAEDVTLGVRNAIAEVSELIGRPLLDGQRNLIKPYDGKQGVDMYLSTSSAGGGLQMIVAGVVRQMSAASAQKAALGAGAVVMETFAANDRRLAHEKTEIIRRLRPDMVLLAGGVDGGTKKHVTELAQLFAAADARPRLGSSYSLPVIYAGNREARAAVGEILMKKTALEFVENLRPTLETENLQPARLKIQEQFLEHVMAHAPGYPNLIAMADRPIMPTPAAVGSIIQRVADKYKANVLGVDIGGATTDVFSVFSGVYNRTVSANYGMSYSISNVLSEAGEDSVKRWVPFKISGSVLRNSLKNKMIRPTSIPYTVEDLQLEQALCREALRLSFEQHRLLATGLKGVQRQADIGAMFDQSKDDDSLVNLLALDMIIGSGGVLSHAPKRSQAALMMVDAFLPEGITRLAVDSIFMMPQLGVLGEVFPDIATSVFEKDCLVELGTCVAPVGPGRTGRTMLTGQIGDRLISLNFGDLQLIPLAGGQNVYVELQPARGFDIGAGPGQLWKGVLYGGQVGILLDGRGRRPFSLAVSEEERLQQVKRWQDTVERAH